MAETARRAVTVQGGRGALTQVIRKLQETAGKMVDMQQALIMAVTAEIVNTEPEAPEEQKKVQHKPRAQQEQ